MTTENARHLSTLKNWYWWKIVLLLVFGFAVQILIDISWISTSYVPPIMMYFLYPCALALGWTVSMYDMHEKEDTVAQKALIGFAVLFILVEIAWQAMFLFEYFLVTDADSVTTGTLLYSQMGGAEWLQVSASMTGYVTLWRDTQMVMSFVLLFVASILSAVFIGCLMSGKTKVKEEEAKEEDTKKGKKDKRKEDDWWPVMVIHWFFSIAIGCIGVGIICTGTSLALLILSIQVPALSTNPMYLFVYLQSSGLGVFQRVLGKHADDFFKQQDKEALGKKRVCTGYFAYIFFMFLGYIYVIVLGCIYWANYNEFLWSQDQPISYWNTTGLNTMIAGEIPFTLWDGTFNWSLSDSSGATPEQASTWRTQFETFLKLDWAMLFAGIFTSFFEMILLICLMLRFVWRTTLDLRAEKRKMSRQERKECEARMKALRRATRAEEIPEEKELLSEEDETPNPPKRSSSGSSSSGSVKTSGSEISDP